MRKTLQALFLGQLISFILALLSFSASLNASLGVNTPLTLAFFAHLLLALVYGSILLYRRQKLVIPWYWYLLLGFVDIQGNYLANKAYEYSSITSVTILDCWTIAWVMILTWLFLGARYSPRQFCGITICLLGLGLVLLSDAGLSGGGGTKPLLGDSIIIVGTLFFALSNVGEEFCVKKNDLVEVVSMLGLFGVLISVCEIAILEMKTLESVQWTAITILVFASYAVGSFMFYTFTPYVLKTSGSALFNLSLLTSDMWAVVIRILFYHQQVDWLYYLSFATVVIGLVIYSKDEQEDPTARPSPDDGNPNSQYQILLDQSAEDI